MPLQGRTALFLVMGLGAAGLLQAQAPVQTPVQAPATSHLKDEMRMPWTRGDQRFLRQWLVVGALPGALDVDALGGEAALAAPAEGQEIVRSNGTKAKWHNVKSWGDDVSLDDVDGPKDEAFAYAFTRVKRDKAGRAVLSVGSAGGVRVWLNGKLVLSRDGRRSLTPDEDQLDVELQSGENRILVKVPCQEGAPSFCARLLEPGTVLARVAEIGPSITAFTPTGFTLKTDIAQQTHAAAVKVEVIAPGGTVLWGDNAARGAVLQVDTQAWPEGPYDVRCSTQTPRGRLFVVHLPVYKGDALIKARELAKVAAQADGTKPEGATFKMLAEMVEDRLGCKLADAKPSPQLWARVHAPLMEFDELMLERKGQVGRIRASGFVRLAYRDEVDGSMQYCRAYLPAHYDPAKKWPMVLQLHGYNSANPIYVRWWGADSRHAAIDAEFGDHQGVIYLEPHGRGNTRYLGMGDADNLKAVAEAKRLFNVDEDRVYLAGDSMGGWGTWNVGMRHPDLFAAIAPVFGGADYHAVMPEETLARLTPLQRFFQEKESSMAMVDGLLNTPISILHGDADAAVNVDYSRWNTRLLQRWGYDVRYHEFPGRSHEALGTQNGNMSIEWFLQHRRNLNPRQVRIRSAELRHASAFWASIDQAESPMAFMAVDAEVMDRNLIRLDTDNVAAIHLTPSTLLVDTDKPVKVVWNGVAREVPIKEGRLTLMAPGFVPTAQDKKASLPGGMADFTATPFAIIIGTSSKDPDMKALCRRHAEGLIHYWKEWQKQSPRVFLDTELKDEDMARYSLLLVGGADANGVSRKLADKLGVSLTPDCITVDGHAFPVKNAAIQVLRPHPLNPERYVLLAAGTSTDGMFHCRLNDSEVANWDYAILDGRVAAAAPHQLRVVSGMFDRSWKFNESLAFAGDAAIRDKSRQILRPKAGYKLNPALLDSFTGRFQIERGPFVTVTREGDKLMAQQQGSPKVQLLPLSESDFFIAEANIQVHYVRDAAGKVTAFSGIESGNEFVGKKVE